MIQPIQIFKINPNAITPTYGTERSACFDIYACLDCTGIIYSNTHVLAVRPDNFFDNIPIQSYENRAYISMPPGYRVLVPTGIVFGLPSRHSLRLHIRSGISLKNGLMLANSEAIIDNDYPKETFVMLVNMSDVDYRIYHGDRIAQGELVQDVRWDFSVVDFNPVIVSDRRDGLGHTGK